MNNRPAPQSPRSPMATRVEGKAVEGAKDNSGLRESSQERAARKLGIVLPETPRDQISSEWSEVVRRLEGASDEREADVERTALLLCALINDNQHRAIGTVFEAFASMDNKHGTGDRVGRGAVEEEEKETKGAEGAARGAAGGVRGHDGHDGSPRPAGPAGRPAGPAGDNERQSVASLHLKASHNQDKHCYLDLNNPNPALAALQLRFCEPHGRNLMALAASTGHVDCIRALHRQGGDVNMGSEQDRTAAMWAARSDKTECLVALHELGVDMSSSCDSEMNAPAYWAAKCGNVAALHTLKHECGVDLKASVNYGNVVDDTTVLYWLAWFGQGAAICEIADLELDLELDAPCCDDDWTPLQIARVKGHEECAGMIEARMRRGAGGGGTRSTWVCPGMTPGGAAEREQKEASANDTADTAAVAVAVTAAAGRRALSVSLSEDSDDSSVRPLSEDSDDNSHKRESSCSVPAERPAPNTHHPNAVMKEEEFFAARRAAVRTASEEAEKALHALTPEGIALAAAEKAEEEHLKDKDNMLRRQMGDYKSPRSAAPEGGFGAGGKRGTGRGGGRGRGRGGRGGRGGRRGRGSGGGGQMKGGGGD